MDNKEEATEESMQSDALLRILNQQLTAAYQRDPKNITEVTFERVIEEFQDEAGGSKSELSYLMVIEDKLSDIADFAAPDFKGFLALFGELLEAKIGKLKKKEKKSELSNYDRIVSGNFKKKTEEKCYLEVEEPRAVRRSKEKDRRSKEKDRLDSNRKDKNPSNDNKLNRLFSKEKNQLREGGLKDSARVAEDQPLNQTAVHAQDESVSFSSVLATSVAVKSRRRKGSTEGKKEKAKVEEDRHKEKEEGDEAFIFYRPKKGKK